jgi:hypothetical protein
MAATMFRALPNMRYRKSPIKKRLWQADLEGTKFQQVWSSRPRQYSVRIPHFLFPIEFSRLLHLDCECNNFFLMYKRFMTSNQIL